jgi:hypothetical protein
MLDENLLEDQRQLLRKWRISVRQIGHDIGHKGMQDEEVIPLLLTLHRPTFFTFDFDFYQRTLCHMRYCLVCMEVGRHEVATYVRRSLQYPEFNTAAKRMGKVIRLSSVQLVAWELRKGQERTFDWAD